MNSDKNLTSEEAPTFEDPTTTNPPISTLRQDTDQILIEKDHRGDSGIDCKNLDHQGSDPKHSTNKKPDNENFPNDKFPLFELKSKSLQGFKPRNYFLLFKFAMPENLDFDIISNSFSLNKGNNIFG